uniref:DDB1-and CUL4-associated factor 8 n=1 Tax=Aceria tosichella TaxID=561515 RepID=A0A6G1SP27_9ACAR
MSQPPSSLVNNIRESLRASASGRVPMSDDNSDDNEDRALEYHGFVPAMAYNDGDFDLDGDSLDIDSDDDEAESINHCLPEEYLKYDPTPDTPYPKPDWITLNELRARKRGFASTKRPTKRPNMDWFQRYARGSLWMIQRLQLERKLQSHNGPVNCLDFNSSADLICSGGDDLTVCIWEWQKRSNNLKAKINSGHTGNVFQTRFCNSGTNVVSTSRDGTVRLIDIETTQSDHLMTSSGEIGGTTFIDNTTLLTCGTNASVNLIDLRTRQHKRMFIVRNPKNNRTCPLHTIDSHPMDKNIIAVAGSSAYVFMYDLRRFSRDHHDAEIVPKNCLGVFENPHHIVTSIAFNSMGDKLLVSYNYDDLYVFNTNTCSVAHKYRGHRNKKTIKGCAWFGDHYVLSGSDCGHIYGWDLESEHIVCFLQGDNGIVNSLCVHPTLPILASSGLDSDIKIWEPISNTWPQTMKGIKPQICKNFLRRKRADERRTGNPHDLDESDDYDDESYNNDGSNDEMYFDYGSSEDDDDDDELDGSSLASEGQARAIGPPM